MKNFKEKIKQEITDFAEKQPDEYNLIIEKIRSYRHGDYSVDYYDFQPFKDQLVGVYLNEALKKYQISRSESLKHEIISIADYKLDRRYDVMIALNDDDAFKKVMNYATDFLKGDYFVFFQELYVNGESLFALVQAYYNPKFKQDVLLFFNSAFEYAKYYAKEKLEYGKKADKDPDGETLLELVQAISSFKEADREQFADLIFEIYKFTSDENKRSYELMQASGFMAIQLPFFQTQFDIEVLNNAITKTGKYYPETTFVKQTLYTKWFLEKNTEAPLLYFQDNETKGSLSFAVFALTDLNCKEALPLFIEKQKEDNDPVMWEIYNEAILRLQSDFIAEKPEDRMISLNGNLTPTQRALGAESNNVFVKRAQQKVTIDDTVYETDDE